MCGIIGFTGKKNVIPGLLDGLSALEYRGYDSAGIAFFDRGALQTIKSAGTIARLRDKGNNVTSRCGIGHTRWATHGAPTETNAHPHGTARVQIVHNGIIENDAEIKTFLFRAGYTLCSETDTEAAAKLLDYYFAETGEPIAAIQKLQQHLRGSYAIGALFGGYDGKLYAFRKDNPLIAVSTASGGWITSDFGAIQDDADRFYEPEEGEIAVVDAESIVFWSAEGTPIQKEAEPVRYANARTDKGAFPHFMLKEIYEEPDALRETVCSALSNGVLAPGGFTAQRLQGVTRVHIVACGTAYHAGLIGKVAIETMSRVATTVYYASEFRYMNPIVEKTDLVIAISQSGETADTLAAMRLAKQRGIDTFAIVNQRASTLAREADAVFYTCAGAEISVASTKAYHVQLAALYLLAMTFAESRGRLDTAEKERLLHILRSDLPDQIRATLHDQARYDRLAEQYKSAKSIFFIGRGIDRAQCEEAALKVKEISYIHCEAYPAGELKHGTISLIETGTPVIAILTQTATADKLMSNLREVKARGARVILFVTRGITVPDGTADEIVPLAETEECFMPLVCGTAAQLLAYYMSRNLGHDVDKPRNLAKSVTVE